MTYAQAAERLNCSKRTIGRKVACFLGRRGLVAAAAAPGRAEPDRRGQSQGRGQDAGAAHGVSVTVTPPENAESCSSRLAGTASAAMSNTTTPVSELPGLISS